MLVEILDLMELDPIKTRYTSMTRSAIDADLPDISVETKTSYHGILSQVGMQKIEIPVRLEGGGSLATLIPAEVDAFVSLDDPDAKGIHMSRLYLELKNTLQIKPLSVATVKEILKNFLSSHETLSKKAFLEIRFTMPVERKALVSQEVGYRQYPVVYRGKMTGNDFEFTLGVEILYSSTCPCSAALASQVLQSEFAQKFGQSGEVKTNEVLAWLGDESSIVAVAHSQRSLAKVFVRVHDSQMAPTALQLIDRLEKALGTPVQSAVKRIDEQEFARLSAQNLMFCEDAARKVRGELESDNQISDYSIHVEHQESLHPHNAVSRVVKGIAGGFSL